MRQTQSVYNELFVKAKRWNIVLNFYDIDAIFDNCDQTLFRSSLNSNHCLYHMYPGKRDNTHNMTLRPRGHNFRLLALSISKRGTRL